MNLCRTKVGRENIHNLDWDSWVLLISSQFDDGSCIHDPTLDTQKKGSTRRVTSPASLLQRCMVRTCKIQVRPMIRLTGCMKILHIPLSQRSCRCQALVPGDERAKACLLMRPSKFKSLRAALKILSSASGLQDV